MFDLLPAGLGSSLQPGELPEQVQHVLEELALGAASPLAGGQPDQLDRTAHGQFAPQVEIDEFPVRVLDVVEQSDRGVVTPLQRIPFRPGRVLALVVDQRMGA